MKTNQKLFIILGALIISLLGVTLLLFNILKDKESTKNNVPDNVVEDINDAENENNEEDPEEHFDEEVLDNHNSGIEGTVFDNDDPIHLSEDLVLSQPVLMEGFYEEEWATTLDGVYDGKLMTLFSVGYDEIILYDIETKKRTTIDEFTKFTHVDPKTGMIVYARQKEGFVGDPKAPLEIYKMSLEDYKIDHIGDLEESESIIDGVVFNGIFFYTSMTTVDSEGKSSMKMIPIPGEYNEVFYEDISDALKGNTFQNVVTDGERLIASSLENRKLSELTTGGEVILHQYPEELYLPYVEDVLGDRILFTIKTDFGVEDRKLFNFGKIFSNKDFYKPIENSRDNIFFEVKIIDDDNFLYVDETEPLYLFNEKSKEESVLAAEASSVVVSGNRIFFIGRIDEPLTLEDMEEKPKYYSIQYEYK